MPERAEERRTAIHTVNLTRLGAAARPRSGAPPSAALVVGGEVDIDLARSPR
jgi:hypothetical protein